MTKHAKALERESEIITFFYLIFGNRIHSGMDQVEARNEAFDAVSLRYGIGRGRLQNIISARKSFQSVNQTGFRENARNLIAELEIANKGYSDSLSKNNQLIALLKECIDER